MHLELPTTPLTLQRLQIAERRRRPGAGIDGMGVSVSLSCTQSGGGEEPALTESALTGLSPNKNRNLP